VTHYETIVGGLVAIVAGLLYLGRQVGRMSRALTFWSALPEEHRELMAASETNTRNIADLTKAVDRLARLDEQERRDRRARGRRADQ